MSIRGGSGFGRAVPGGERVGRRDFGSAPSLATAALVGIVGGVLTAWGQEWLPDSLSSLANSAGSWSLLAFAVALLARTPRTAALSGFLTLAGLLAGYVVTDELRGLPSSSSTVLFWVLAAVAAGPLIGIGAYWVGRVGGEGAALGAGGMAGVLVGEGVYGLTRIADSTYPPYWVASIVVGALVLGAASWLVLRVPRLIGSAVLACAVVTGAFVLLYAQGGSLLDAL